MPAPTVRLADGRTVRLGRIRPLGFFDVGRFRVIILPGGAQKIVPRLDAYYSPHLDATPPPDTLDYWAKAAASVAQVYGNDQWGDCVIASAMHEVGLWSGNETGSPAVGNTTEAVNTYHSWCGAGDNGCVITSVLDNTRSVGIPVNGVPHKIDDYVAVDWTNPLLVKVAIEIFGSLKLGINLPQAWTSTNTTWDVTNTGIVGGHDVPAGGFTPQGVRIATWGGLVTITWPAFTSRTWLEEAYCPLSPDWYARANVAPSGIDAATLRADLAMLRNGQIPDPGPGPVVHPCPVGQHWDGTQCVPDTPPPPPHTIYAAFRLNRSSPPGQAITFRHPNSTMPAGVYNVVGATGAEVEGVEVATVTPRRRR